MAGEGDGWEGNVLLTFTPLFGEFHGGRLQGIYIFAVANGNYNVTLWKEAVAGEWQRLNHRCPDI